MNLKEEIKNKIKDHAQRVSPEECCGLLIELEDNGEIKIIECENIAEDKENLFKISIEEYLEALSEGDIYAVYHSHTKGENSFSEADKTISDSLELRSVLYNLPTDVFEILEPKA
jgi:proteasome lid subunit RPN8/RPN11